MKYSFFALLLFIIPALNSCRKGDYCKKELEIEKSKKILIDASKDGGTWWFPQGPGANNPNLNHQGKKLADYLRSLGYQVDELTQGSRVSWSMLQNYSKVIRAGAIYSYTSDELKAYDSLLKRPSSLLLMQDHLTYFSNDMLSEHLNIRFAGVGGTTIARFNTHAITQGVSSIPFTAGSAIINSDKTNMTILGYLPDNEFIDMNNNKILDAGDIAGAPVMGILHHPSSKIFFIGDVNGLETVSQPFTTNLFKWLLN